MSCPGIVRGYRPHRLHDTGAESVFVRLRACQFSPCFRRLRVVRSATRRVLPPLSGLCVPVGSLVLRVCRRMQKKDLMK